MNNRQIHIIGVPDGFPQKFSYYMTQCQLSDVHGGKPTYFNKKLATMKYPCSLCQYSQSPYQFNKCSIFNFETGDLPDAISSVIYLDTSLSVALRGGILDSISVFVAH